jgi:hypothetical protein
MKARIFITVLVALTLILAACSAATPAPTEAPKAPKATEKPAANPPAQPPAVQPKDYPAPGQYPAPGAAPQAGQPAAGSLYPDMKTGETLQPEQVFGLLQNGEVTEIVQEASGRATVMLKDGRSLTTQAPDKAYFEAMLKNCGEACKNVKLTAK